MVTDSRIIVHLMGGKGVIPSTDALYWWLKMRGFFVFIAPCHCPHLPRVLMVLVALWLNECCHIFQWNDVKCFIIPFAIRINIFLFLFSPNFVPLVLFLFFFIFAALQFWYKSFICKYLFHLIQYYSLCGCSFYFFSVLHWLLLLYC